MLNLRQKLPPGALIGGEGPALSRALSRTGGAWFSARTADVMQRDGRIIGWRETTGAVEAATTEPNVGNSSFDPGPPAAFVLQRGQHCGFAIPDFAPTVAEFTAAIRYTSPTDDARTLLSVTTGQSNNLIFLTEGEGRLSVRDRRGTVDLHLPVPAEHIRLVVFSYTGQRLHLRSLRQSASTDSAIPGMDHPGSLFIGCRSSRPGLTKTLGDARLHDVIFWPETSLLGTEDPAHLATLAALDRYHRWPA